jgi:hypothetical protein
MRRHGVGWVIHKDIAHLQYRTLSEEATTREGICTGKFGLQSKNRPNVACMGEDVMLIAGYKMYELLQAQERACAKSCPWRQLEGV